MTRKPLLVAVTVFLSSIAWAGPDRVQVRYLQPEKFTDAGRYWGGDASREHNLAELARHIERRAARLLPEGRRLVVSVADIDLAGGYEPWRRNLGDVRIVRDVHPPRIELGFQLMDADGSLLKEGARKLRDPVFAITGSAYRDDPLRYEKALLDAWLERELKP